MSILFGFSLPIIFFTLSLPLKASIKAVQIKLNTVKKEEKGNSVNSSKKPLDLIRNKDSGGSKENVINKKVKELKLLLKSLHTVEAFLTTLKSAITLLVGCLSIFTIFILLLIFLLFTLLVSVINSDASSSYLASDGSIVTSGSSSNKNGYVSMPVEADVKKIIDMSESEIWSLISEGKYSSYSEANAAAQVNFEAEKAFWEGLLVTVDIPVWSWKDDTKTEKIESTRQITVNKHVADFWVSFMTELHNCPEKYVIYSSGGQKFRTKNNGTGTSNLSAHSFGVVLDINTSTKGMGSNAAGIGDGTPWNSDSGLSEPYRSEACAFTGNWFELVKKYRLDWGGLWSERYLDPMHFSIVGDNNRDTRNYQPKTSGRNPE